MRGSPGCCGCPVISRRSDVSFLGITVSKDRVHNSLKTIIHVQYSDIMRFLVRHNRHHKVSQSVPLFKSRKTVTIFFRIKVGRHFVMSIVTCHESHYVGVLDNPLNLAYNFCVQQCVGEDDELYTQPNLNRTDQM